MDTQQQMHKPKRQGNWKVQLRPIVAALVIVMMTALGLGLNATAASAQPGPDRLITKDGGGTALVGSTLAELTAQLGPTYTITDVGQVLVDLFGYEVSQNGVVQFYALALQGQDELDLFVFEDPSWQTADSIGPESTIAAGETAYGDATLSVSEIESREFVRFANQPAGRFFFRTSGGGGGNEAGIYAPDQNTTMNYVDGAQINTVWVSCVVGSDCPPQLAITGPAFAVRLSIMGLVLIAAGLVMTRGTRARRRAV